MDARKTRWAIVAVMSAVVHVTASDGATYRTPNFVVTAPTKDFAVQVGKAAEYYREELAVAWLGKELPKWYRPCPISVRVGQIGAGGATSFQFDRGEVFGWKMSVQGTEERILDSVIPHEVSHTIFASYFRRPLPRWADEGAATVIEHESERLRQMETLQEVTRYGTRYSLRKLMSIKEYPQSHQRLLTLYAQGYSLADYLIQKRGRKTFLDFLETAHHHGWDNALHHHYKLKNIEQLEQKWNNWYMAGSPRLNLPEGDLLADAENDTAESVVRAQSPEEKTAVVLGESSGELTAEPAAKEPAAEPLEATSKVSEAVVAHSEDSAALKSATESAIADVKESKAGSSLDEFQLRGRRNVVAAGWEPVPVGGDGLTASKRITSSARPPFVEETSLAVRERPLFRESPGRPERPPFVK